MRFRDGERGASAVEFALIASLLFLIVFGIVQFGLAYNRVQGLQAATREGARVGSLPTSSVDDIETRVTNTLSATISAPNTGPGNRFSANPATNFSYIWITRRDAVDNSLTTYATGADHPCNGSYGAEKGDTILVDMSYRMLIQVPPIMSFPVTIKATGEFLCEI
jgi:Flp pilus assembly protein TadG